VSGENELAERISEIEAEIDGIKEKIAHVTIELVNESDPEHIEVCNEQAFYELLRAYEFLEDAGKRMSKAYRRMSE